MTFINHIIHSSKLRAGLLGVALLLSLCALYSPKAEASGEGNNRVFANSKGADDTPSPTPTASPSPSPNTTPTPNATPSPNATPTPNATPSPNATPTPTATPGATPNPTPTPGAGEVEIEAALTGASINGVTPHGEAKFEIEAGNREFEVEVENVNLPGGTVLNVLVDNARVGTLTLDGAGRGKFKVETENGQTVPNITSRTRVVVTNQAGATVLAGAFNSGVSPNPTPTPSGSVETRIESRLAGAAINGLTPRGEAETRTRADGRRQFKVEVEKVNLPAGTVLNVLVDNVKVGEIRISSLLEGELELESEHGQVVPSIVNGSTVVITNQAGATILSSTFNTSVVQSDDGANHDANDNDIDDSHFFVEQQYHDFFDREPDDNGLSFWTNEITSCGGDAACIERKRINTSGAFFLSVEFQNTGYLLYRFNKASFGTMPRRLAFLMDMQAIGQGVIVNAPGWEAKLAANKNALIEQWVNRAAFKAIFDAMTNAQFVDALFANAGITPTQTERDSLVNGLNAGTETRASVLRKIAENQAFYQKEYNPAFVLMQYFGYLHRNPDEGLDHDLSGFNFWLNKLNSHGGDFHKAEMVKAFIQSGEYRDRFQW